MQTLFSRKGHVKVATAAACLSILILACAPSFDAEKKTPPDVREQAWSVLTDGLRHPHASHRALAVQALALMPGNRRAAQFAIRALSDKDFHVRAAAALSLGPMQAMQAKPGLHEALNDQEISVVLAAAHSLYL